MECRDAKELLSAYQDGEVSAEESRQVEEHLAACEGCRVAQKRMLALDAMIARSETEVSPDFREKLFSRMEAEELLPRRRSLFSLSFRWALPLAAAAALGLFLLMSKEAPRGPVTPGSAPQVALAPAETPKAAAQIPGAPPEGTRVAVNRPEDRPSTREELTAEEREIVAYLEVLEDPSSFEDPGEVDEMEIFLPPGRSQG